MKSDHYKILEVRRDAPLEEIQHAYRNLALRYHPDRNPAPDAATRMRAINEAWEVLGDSNRRAEYDALLNRPVLHPEFAAAILLAARDLLLRGGWRVLEENARTLMLESARQKVRVFFFERVDNTMLAGLVRQFPEFCVVLALRVEGPVRPGAVVIDLIRSECHGTALPDGPDGASCRSLFAPFL
jgi:DnaJ-domain-containing protein 1